MPAIVNPSTHTFWLLNPLNGGIRMMIGSRPAAMVMPTITEIERWRSEKSRIRPRNDGPLTWPVRVGMSRTSAVMRALPAAGRAGRMVGRRA